MKASHLALLAASLWVLVSSADDGYHSPLTRQVQALFSVAEQTSSKSEAPSHPLIIRVHEKAFAAATGNQVDHTRPVDRLVVGTRARGACRTQGTIHVDASSGKDSAAFAVSFQGRAHARTIGVNGPARIYSHSITDFLVQRTVTFSPLEGFQSQPSVVQQSTRLTLDDVQAAQGGLRGAIVRRVAWRRARESHAAAEQRVARHAHQELSKEFDHQLDQRVADLNRQLQIARYVNSILGGSEKLSVQVSSNDSCVQLAVGSAGAAGTAVEFPSGCPTTPIEVRVHQSALKERAGLWGESLALVANRAAPMAASLQMLKLIAWQPDNARGIDIHFDGGWAVVSIDPFATKPKPAEREIARHTAK